MAAGTVYAGWDDGRLYARTFDGQTLGPPVDPASWATWETTTGMFWTSGRLYFTVDGDLRLFYRHFTPESGYAGAETYVASGDGDGLDWSAIRGMALAAGGLYYATSDGNL